MPEKEFHLTTDFAKALPLSEIVAFSVFEEAADREIGMFSAYVDNLLIYPDENDDGSLVSENNSHFAELNEKKLVSEFKKAGISLVEITGRRNESLFVREDRLSAVQASLDAH